MDEEREREREEWMDRGMDGMSSSGNFLKMQVEQKWQISVVSTS